MNFYRLFLVLIISLLFADCQTPSEKIEEAFNTVDNSLEQSHRTTANAIENIYTTIKANKDKNPSLALIADTIYFTSSKAILYIDSLKQVLQIQDTTGIDLGVSTNLFINTKTGKELENILLSVYSHTNDNVSDKSRIQQLDSIFHSIKQIKSDKHWANKYFYQTPTVATLTILSKFQNDCTNSTVIVLEDIKNLLLK